MDLRPAWLPLAILPFLTSMAVAAPLITAPVPGAAPLQLTSLAAATCLEASGQLRPDQSALLLALQGRYWGWPRQWQQGIDPRRVLALIQRQGGCGPLLQALRRARQPAAPGPARSEVEGFGLAPYR